jgi:hypothetical protein
MTIDNYTYVTNQIFPHGGGTRISFLLNAIMYSKIENKEFLITPLSYETEKKEFNTNPITKTFDYPNYCKRWDSVLNLNGKKIYDLPKEEHEKVLHLCFATFNNTPPIDSIINDKIRLLKTEIKNEYFKIPKKDKNDKIKLSVHIRRNDAITWPHRYVPNEYYVNTINVVKEFLSKNNISYDLKIYTERNGFNNKGLEEYKIYFDDEVLDTDVWFDLINSDIIIGSKSAFSTSAGLLTDGMYIHPEKKDQLLVSDWLYSCELDNNKLKKRFYEIK